MAASISVLNAQATGWGDLAAAQLHHNMLLRVWEVEAQSVLLVGDPAAGEVVRLVGDEVGHGPLHLIVAAPEAAFAALRRGTWVWRVGRELWFGDSLTLRLPDVDPWPSALTWTEVPLDEVTLRRRLTWLADALLARAPEGDFGGLLPELVVSGTVTDRSDLDPQERLLRWRAGRVLTSLMPALAQGDVAQAEQAVNWAAGLGPGSPPAGDRFLLGLLAGLRLWPAFLEATGLNQETLVRRLARSAAERTGILGGAMLRAAQRGAYGEDWHRLAAILQHEDACGDERRQALEDEVLVWLENEGVLGSSALAGLVLPLLWEQRGPASS